MPLLKHLEHCLPGERKRRGKRRRRRRRRGRRRRRSRRKKKRRMGKTGVSLKMMRLNESKI